MARLNSKALRVALYLGAPLTVLALFIALFYVFELRINLTNSLPYGLYRLTTPDQAKFVSFCTPNLPDGSSAYSRGYTIAGVCPDGGSRLLKPIAAYPGDTVFISPAGVAVNNIVLANSAPIRLDGRGRSLPVIDLPSSTVPSGFYYVVSSHHKGSFDSRYFGALSLSNINEYLIDFATF